MEKLLGDSVLALVLFLGAVGAEAISLSFLSIGYFFFLSLKAVHTFFLPHTLFRVHSLTRVPHRGSRFRAFFLRPISISVRVEPRVLG
jgi:hypothetical protein